MRFNRIHLVSVLLAISFGGFFSSLGAATIQCDPSNFLSLVANAKPGDTFILSPGSYPTFNGCPPGTASAPILIKGQTGVKFSHIGFYGSQFSYTTIDSVLVDGSQMIFGNGAHHLTLQNSEVRNIRGQAGGVELYGVNDCAVLNTFIHDVGTRANYDHGIYMYGLRNRIEGNRIQDVAAYGIHNYSGGKPNGQHIIRKNYITRNGRVTPTQSIFAIVSTSGDGVIIEQNTIENCIGGIGLGGNVTNIQANYNTILNISGEWPALDANGSGQAQNNKVNPNQVVIRSSGIQASNNNLTAPGAGGGDYLPPPTDVDVTQTPPQQQPPPTGGGGSLTAGASFPLIAGAVILGAILLSD